MRDFISSLIHFFIGYSGVPSKIIGRRKDNMKYKLGDRLWFK